MMGETLAQTLCGNKIPYNPGHWFNSAKFLDIEYQTYGWVFSDRTKKENEMHFHWRHPKEKICITVAFDKTSNRFLGINTFGIRMRHEIFDRWLGQGKGVDHVMEHLKDAHFDPEFHDRYESDILTAYNRQFNTRLKIKKEKLATYFQWQLKLKKGRAGYDNLAAIQSRIDLNQGNDEYN